MNIFRRFAIGFLMVLLSGTGVFAAINGTSYPFTNSSGVALEDMTGATGFTGLTAGNIDDTASAVTTIPFTFSLDGTGYTQFSVNANGLMRLGATVVATTFSNSIASGTNDPKIVALWDDLCTSSSAGGGTVQYKVVGSAPNRKLVVEWKNMKGRTATCSTLADNTLTFQVWLSETSNRIDFVYGTSITLSGNSGFSTGFATSTTNFASVTTATPAVSYTTANNANTITPASGTQYSFIPPATVALSSATYSTTENSGNATITVVRTGNTTGTSSVNYATSDGTATAGADYTATSGTLNFAAGEASKTFSIPISTDYPLADPNETVNITLSGCASCNLGTPSNAVLTILDSAPPLNGSYDVGTGQTYTSLTNAGGIFESINNNGATGNITINIVSDLTGETGTVSLNEIAGGYTVLLKPSGAPRTITGSINGALIKINGADGVRIDGSTAASFVDNIVGGTPALRELTVQNTNTGTASWVIAIQSGTNGANNNVIRNVNILGQDPLTTLGGIAVGGNTPGTAATFTQNGNQIINCSFRRSIVGIYSAGVSATTPSTGSIIRENDLSGTGADRVRRVGIMVFNQDGVQLVENSVGGIDTNESADAIGIAVGNQAVDSTGTTGGGVSNAVVARNKINGVSSTSTTGFSAAGITIAGGTLGANLIANNMITGVISPATSPDLVAGIYVVGATGSNTKLYYNSISMTGNRGTIASQMPSYGVAVTGTDPTVEMKNNIFYNTQEPGSGGVNAKAYAIGMVTTAFANLDANYNLYYSAGTQPGFFRSGSLGTAAGTDYGTLALWQTAISDDANSRQGNPDFVNDANDLHIKSTSTEAIDKGIAVSVLDDFDGQIRSAVGLAGGVPDIGADEYVAPSAASASISGRITTTAGRGIRNVVITLTDANGFERSAVSGAMGYYRFTDLTAGETYILTVRAKRFVFGASSRVISLSEDVTDADFVGDLPAETNPKNQ